MEWEHQIMQLEGLSVINQQLAESQNSPFHKKVVVISIRDTKKLGGVSNIKPASIKIVGNLLDILFLAFDDIEKPERGSTLFTSEQAKQIISFAEKYKEIVSVIICQCVWGRSRSAGVAAALSTIYFGHNNPYFSIYNPNVYVYETILKAWERTKQNA